MKFRTAKRLLTILILAAPLYQPAANAASIGRAAARNDLAAVRQLHEEGESLEGRGGRWSPLMQAAYHASREVLAFLIEQQVDLDYAVDNKNAMLLAWERGHTEIVQTLLRSAADPRPLYNEIAAYRDNRVARAINSALFSESYQEEVLDYLKMIEDLSPWHVGNGTFRRPSLAEVSRPGADGPAPAGGDVLTQLERLFELRQSGAISEEEYELLKARTLNASATPATAD